MNHDAYPDSYLRAILTRTRTIAVIGASPDPRRPSHGVMAFLKRRGFTVIPINPMAAGQRIHGETCLARLADIWEAIDMVDVFRRSDALAGIVDEAIAVGAKTIWTQLGVRDDVASARAEAAGIDVVMDRCPAIEMPRLGL